MVKFLFLDLDDTLLDFHLAERVALSSTLKDMGVEPTEALLSRSKEINRSCWEALERGELTREEVLVKRFEILFGELCLSISATQTQQTYEYKLSLEHQFMDGAIELLDALFGKYKLYIASNGTACVQDRRISDTGIAKYFDGIFISERIGANKPDKEFFDRCFEKIDDFNPDEAMIVGDSLSSDILGGKRANIMSCYFNPHRKPNSTTIIPDFEIHRLDELIPLIERL